MEANKNNNSKITEAQYIAEGFVNYEGKWYLPFSSARPIALVLADSNSITNEAEWHSYWDAHKENMEELHIPRHPDLVYTKTF